ncbi:MAG: ATP-grasp domain-containing protein, partial [Egibacteraceae bacterium]
RGAGVAGTTVEAVLVEQRAPVSRELYAAVLNDPAAKRPLALFSAEGGTDIEELHTNRPEAVLRTSVDIRVGLDQQAAAGLVGGSDLPPAVRRAVAEVLARLYRLYREVDADLVEVNPLALTTDGAVWALDSKVSLDPGARPRHAELFAALEAELPVTGTPLERQAREHGLLFIELDGSVGILANGAGLTMATLDAVTHQGGAPANFLEIGGDAYSKATAAMRLVLGNPRARSILVNFCGAFARTDVMTEGVVAAIEQLRPEIPISFTIHGTGEEAAVRLVRERLGVEPHDRMDDAVAEAVRAAGPVPYTVGAGR